MKYIFVFFFTFFFMHFVFCQKQLELLGHWRDPNIPGSSAYDNAFNEAYGVVVNNREYAVIGHTLGTSFIDITDPTNPKEVSRVPGRFNGTGVVHRDYDLYNCYLFAVSDEGNSSLQIIDFSTLPDSVRVVYDSDSLMTRVHNIYIDIPKSKLYTCAENTNNGFFALGVYDIKEPTNPKFLGHYNVFGDIHASHVHDAYVINDTAYLNCGNNGFAMVDFSDMSQPNTIYTLQPGEYYKSGYNHSGWVTPNGKTYVMADENHGSPLKVMDLSDLRKVKTASILSTPDSSVSIPHNPLVSCDYAYVAYYYNGLQVYNLKDPYNPILEYNYPTCTLPNLLSYKGAWGNYPFLPSGNIVVADMQNGLFVLKGIEKPCNAVNSCSLGTAVKQTTKFKDKVYLYPNPNTGKFQVYNSSSEMISRIEIYDLQGERKDLISSTDRSFPINLAMSLDPGLYFVRVQFANGLNSVIKMNVGK